MQRPVTTLLFVLATLTVTQTLQAQSPSSQTSAKNSATEKAGKKKSTDSKVVQKATTIPADKNSVTKKPAGKSARELVFQRIDSNRDGKIEIEEFLGGSAGKAADNKRQEFIEFDLNKDSSLDFEEFKKQGNKLPDRAKLSEDFKNRDKDSSGSLTLKEFLGNRTGEQKTQAHTAFFRFDSDGNDQVTLPEFLNRDTTKKLTVHSIFRQLDLNDDSQLTEQEFIRPRIGKKTEQSGRDNFRKFDLNRDSRLSEAEFAMLPSNNPDSKAIFRGHDGNHDGQLTLQEHLAGRPEGKGQLAARDMFYRMDTDGDGRLTDGEFVQSEPKTKSDLKAKGKTQIPINATSHFRQLDLDNNGKITEQEFMRLKGGKKGAQVGWDNFRKYDLDGDGQLTEKELSMLPIHKPDAVSMFNALDINHSGGLAREELTRLMGSDQSGRAEETFFSYDKDANGELSIDEYLTRKSSIEQTRSRRAWMRWLDAWGMRLLIGLDAVLLLAVARWIYQRFGHSPPRSAKHSQLRVTH